MTSSALRTMPTALDKLQSSMQTPINRIFDQLVLQLDAACRDESAPTPPPKAESKAEKAPTDTPVQDKSQSLDFNLSTSDDAEDKPRPQAVKITDISESAREEVKAKLSKLKSSFFTELHQQFQQSLNRPSRKLSKSLLDELSLVSHDELDLQIILNHIESNLLDNHQHQLNLLSLRFEHLLKYEVTMNRLPLGPVVLGHAFYSAVQLLQLELHERKTVLMALLINLKNSYGDILEQANELFIKQGILPDLSEDDSRMRQKEEETKKLAEEKRKELFGIDSDSDDRETVSSGIGFFLSQLSIPEEAGQHVIQSRPDAPKISTQELASKVDLLREAPLVSEDGVYRKIENSGLSLAEQLGSKAQLEEYGLDAKSSNTISLMSMVFDNLLGNDSVPGEIKALLTQLQGPMLKAAVQDELFFGDIDNPAQKLFNTIAEASVSWSPEKNPEHDFLYKKMSAVVDKVSNDFDDDYLIFDEAIEDFFTFRETEEKKTSQMESRIIDKETSQARLQTARKTAADHIRKKFGALNLPQAIHDFLHGTWQQLLFYIYNKEHSKDCVAWQDAIEIENSLLANLRRRNEDDVEVFMIVLEEKLQDCGIPEQETEKHLQNIAEALTTGESSELSETAIAAEDSLSEEEDDAYIDLEQKAADDALLKDVHIGSWLYKTSVQPPIKIKVAAHIKFNDTYVMVFRNGMKENNYTRQQLLDMIRSEEVYVIKNELLFDSALEEVISDIR